MERQGVYRLFRSPNFYRLVQRSLETKDKNVRLYTPILHRLTSANCRVCDIGCGPATFYQNFGENFPFTYVGIDPNCSQIDKAREWYPHLDLRCGTAENSIRPEDVFDVITCGVLHHLNDHDAKSLLSIAKRSLKSNGIFISVETYKSEFLDWSPKNLFARLDRGKHVRTVNEYRQLANGIFDLHQIELIEMTNLLRIPYNHLIILIQV